MNNEIKSKINQLISGWPKGTVAAASYLNKKGFSYDLLTTYKKSAWIQSFGRGAYILFDDNVEWPGAVFTLQNQLFLKVHPGGKTALEMKGYAHYLTTGKGKIFLYGIQGLVLPSWFTSKRVGANIELIRTNLFPTSCDDGFSEFKENGFSFRISAPERAALEMLHLVPAKVGFDEAFLVMENLTTLRSEMVQKLLAVCNSIKVKRLFMYMAEKHQHLWLSELDSSQINLGKGKRMIVPNGKLDNKYQITVPRDEYGDSGK